MLDEVVARLVDEDDVVAGGESLFEFACDHQAGVATAEHSDAHTRTVAEGPLCSSGRQAKVHVWLGASKR
ncbi:hypothetical protein GCM10009017_22850 [Halarchaeum rubridurum]|uniref:Uncharacterized protein n=1 Tax=Halarchaeum rubridurum TaxID=489911 RepID=A0A830G3D0_9EURY|nr:hypothetical protein GCM10009017_22850 [Halarchaeum rubridurum]